MPAQRSILATAAAGNIGTELVPLLVKEANTKLVLPTRSAAKLQSSVPASTAQNVTIAEGDLTDPLWFEHLVTTHNVDTVFLCLQGGYGVELDTTLNLFDAMCRAGTVTQVVYVSICGDFVSPAGIEKLARNCGAGHMLVKIPIEARLKYGEYTWSTTVLGPSLFFTNDGRSKEALMERGLFDEPVERSSRVSTRDIALAARNVIFAPKGKYAGQKIQLGTRKQYSRAEIADLWAQALGKEIRPWAGSMEEFEKSHVSVWGKSFARDVVLMYENFKATGFGMSEDEYRRQVEVLGREADDYAGWVRGLGMEWLHEK